MSDTALRARYESAATDNARDLLGYFERRTGNPADAADALSDTFLAAWRQRARLPVEPVEARMWLFGIARNVLLNVRRGERRRGAALDRLRDELTLAHPVADGGSDGGLADAVREAIAALPPEQAELVRLVHWDGFKLVEAAQLLGIPASTARSRYATARAALQVRIASEVGSTVG